MNNRQEKNVSSIIGKKLTVNEYAAELFLKFNY